MSMFRTEHYTAFKRFTAVFLAACLLITPGVLNVSADNGDGTVEPLTPTIYYGANPIANNMVIPINAELVARYSFVVALSELNTASWTIELPDVLKPAGTEPITIMGADSSGNEQNLGNFSFINGVELQIAETFTTQTTATTSETSTETDSETETPTASSSESSTPTASGSESSTPTASGSESSTPTVSSSESSTPTASGSEGDTPPEDGGGGEASTEASGMASTTVASTSQNQSVRRADDADGADPSEQLTVSFEIPCHIDSDKIVVSGSTRTVQIQGFTIIIKNSSVPLSLDEAVTVGAISLRKSGQAQTIGNNDSILSTDLLVLSYEFSMTAEQVTTIRKLQATGGTVYSVEVPIPEGLKHNGSNYFVKITFDEDNVATKREYIFAELVFSPDNNGVFLKFAGDFWTASDEDKVNYAMIQVGCALDMSKIGTGTSYAIRFLNNTTVTIGVGDPRKVHTMQKSGAYQDGVFTWTVTYTPTDGYVKPPITFLDTFDSTEHAFVDGSFSYKVRTTTTSASANVTTGANNATTISYEYSGAVETNIPITFTYQTKLTAAAYAGTAYTLDTVAINTAKILKGAELIADATGKVILSPTDKNQGWLTKEIVNLNSNGTVTGNVIEWKLTVHTWGFALVDLTVHDLLSSNLELVEETSGGPVLRIFSDSLPDLGKPLAMTELTQSGAEFSFAIPLNGSSKYDPVYTITYKTKVTDTSLVDADGKIQGASVTNKARLTFTWPPGIIGVPPVPTVELTGIGVNAPIITKSGVYNPSTHRILWTVKVNPYHMDIQDGATITENLTAQAGMTTTLEHTYWGNFNGNGYFAIVSGGVGDKVLTISVTDLGTKSSSFTFETEVTDSSYYNYTSSGKYGRNVATFSGDVKLDGATVAKPVTDTAKANATVTSTVLEKKAVGYNYIDNTVTWTITVNRNAMPMIGVKVVDTIPEYQEFGGVAGVAADKCTTVTQADGSTKLTIDLGDISSMVTLTLKTKVLVNADERFRKLEQVPVDNSVILVRDAPLAPTEPVSDTMVIDNPILDKTGKEQNGKISYSIDLNPSGMKLTDLANIKLTDTLPDDLRLDIDSVHLWKAVVSASGQVSTSHAEADEVKATDGFVWSYDPATNEFSLQLPGVAERYVLEYECVVLKGLYGDTFTNEIAFEGSYLDAAVQSTRDDVVLLSGYALGLRTGYANLTIYKKDSKSGVADTPLKGVGFELWTNLSGKDVEVDTGKTGADGKLTFYNLNLKREYWLKESETDRAPGYSDVTKAVFVQKSDGTPVPLDQYNITFATGGEYEITILNDRDTVDVSFFKANTNNLALKGAEFTLTDKDNGTTRMATSDVSGKVVFPELPFGEYKLEETKAPAGYQDSLLEYALIVLPDLSYEISVKDPDTGTFRALVRSGIGHDKIYNMPKGNVVAPLAFSFYFGGGLILSDPVVPVPYYPYVPGAGYGSGEDNPETSEPDTDDPDEDDLEEDDIDEDDPDADTMDADDSETDTSDPRDPATATEPAGSALTEPLGLDDGSQVYGVPGEGTPYEVEDVENLVEDPFPTPKPLPQTGTADVAPIMILLAGIGCGLIGFGLLMRKKKKDE